LCDMALERTEVRALPGRDAVDAPFWVGIFDFYVSMLVWSCEMCRQSVAAQTPSQVHVGPPPYVAHIFLPSSNVKATGTKTGCIPTFPSASQTALQHLYMRHALPLQRIARVFLTFLDAILP